MPESTTIQLTENQARFDAAGHALSPGRFEILCITAGKANGWRFPAETLKASLHLWDGVHCFIDHAWTSRSVRDLAGQITEPQWDESAQGIRAVLKPLGPGGGLLKSFGQEILNDQSPVRVGFSADILFKASQRTVQQITRVISLDLVYDPARGGAFLRALNSLSDPALHNNPKLSPPSGGDQVVVSPPNSQAGRHQAAPAQCQAPRGAGQSPKLSGLKPHQRSAKRQEALAETNSLKLSDHMSHQRSAKRHQALANTQRTNPMPEQKPQPPEQQTLIENPPNPDPPETPAVPRTPTPADVPVLSQLQRDQEAMRQLLSEHDRQVKLDQALEDARGTRLQMCAYLLESGLSASKLPKPIQDRIRLQFKDRIFEAGELQDAIIDSRAMLSELTAAQDVKGPGRISHLFDERDKLQAAVDDLFEAPRDDSLKSLNIPRLSGVRELYLMLTGDHELHGGYYPDRVHLATTADFTGLVKNALNKIVINAWDMLGRAGYDWWQNIVVSEHFNSLQDVTGTLIGTVGDLPVVEEGAEYTELQIGDSPETASFTKYGGYIPLTLELIDRDQTRKLKAYARELGSAGLRKISSLVAQIFTANAGVGPTMADTGALFNATAVATAGGHANLLTSALAINTWEAACQAIYNQPMLIKNAVGFYGTGPKMAINPKFCLVPRTLQYTAWQMLQGQFVREATYTYDNILKGSAVPVTVPEWTDADDWAAVCDPTIAPAIYVGERFGIMPEIYVAGDELSPAVFMNDEHRLKVRHFLAVWVNDFRPLHKSNV